MFHTACIRYLDHLDHVDAPARLQLVSTPVSWNVDEKKVFLGLLEGKGGGAGLQTVHPVPWFTGEADSPKIRRKMHPRPTAISGSLGHHSIVFFEQNIVKTATDTAMLRCLCNCVEAFKGKSIKEGGCCVLSEKVNGEDGIEVESDPESL